MMENNDRRDGEVHEHRAGGRSAQGGRSGPSWALIALIVVVIAIVLFVLSNNEDVPIDLLVTDIDSPLWVVIAISIAFGVVLTRLIGFISASRPTALDH